MRRALTPSRSETKLDNLMWASSSRASSWFCNRTLLRVSWYFRRVTVRHSRCSASGTKLRTQLVCHQPLHQTFGVGKILLASPPSTIRSCLRQMERSRHWACTFSLLAARFPVPFQCSPDGFPILCSRFHHDFLDLVLDQPAASNRRCSGLLPYRIRSNWYSPSNFHVGHDHSQHLFMYVDSRYPVRHNVSSWRERRACCEFLKQGHRLSPLPQEGRDNAQLFAQPRTLRIRHIDSLNCSTENSISPLRASPILPSTRSNFHEISRAAGPS